MSRESKAIKDEIQRNRDEAYLNGWNDGYAEGYGKATADAPTFTAADLERAWRMGRDEAAHDVDCGGCKAFGYCIEPTNCWHEAANEIRALNPPADLAQRVKKGPAHD